MAVCAPSVRAEEVVGRVHGRVHGLPYAQQFLDQAVRNVPGARRDSQAGSAPPSPESEETMLKEKIRQTALECQEAQKQKQNIEAMAVSRGIELGSEVAHLRIDVEVLKRDLERANAEVFRARRGASQEDRRERKLKEQAQRQDAQKAQRAAEEARRNELAREVQGYAEDRSALQTQVRSLEEEVQQHVIGRVRLEALLRSSEVRETQLRRLLEAAEAQRAREAQERAELNKLQSFTLADDSEEEADSEADDNSPNPRESTDLEFSYEGLDIPGIMSLEHALQLAGNRLGGGGGGYVPGLDSRYTAEVQEEEAFLPPSSAWPATHADESLYEEPLRELQMALARLQAVRHDDDEGARSRPRGSTGANESPEAHAVLAAGTGEATDIGAFETQVTQLQHALSRISASVAASQVSPRELFSSPAPPQQRAAQDESPLEAEDMPLSAPASPSRRPPPLQSTEVLSPPSGGGGAPAGFASAPVSPLMAGLGLGGLFVSPYRRLGQKYVVAAAAAAAAAPAPDA